MTDIRSGRHRFVKEDVLKTSEHDLNIIGPYNFSQAVSCQMPIPTSTPPTIGYDGMTLRMYYQIRAKVRLTDIIDKPKTVILELPIAVGTWPLADIPIDDDDDDDSVMMSVASDIDEPIPVAHHDNINNTTNSNSINSKKSNTFRMSGDITAFTLKQKSYRNSTPNIALIPQQDTDEAVVDRSDSKSSKRSESSWRSNQSWDSQPLSRNTSLTTPDKLSSSSSFARTPTSIEPSLAPPTQSAPPCNGNKRNSMHLDHHSPTYHYQQLPQPQQAQQQYRQSAFFPSATTSTLHSAPARPYYPAPVPVRVHDDSMMTGYPSVPSPPYSVPQNVTPNGPNHILQPMGSTAPYQQQTQFISHHVPPSSTSISQSDVIQPNDTYMTDSSDDSSDDDGDLLRIVRKKKKAEQKRKQQSMRL